MNNKEIWLKNYELAQIYYNHHGNLEIPQKFITIDGYTYDDNGFKLGLWIVKQRQNYKHGLLDEKKISLLKEINMRFDNKILSWNEAFELAQIYYEHYSNLNVPRNFKTKDGHTYNENGTNLESWLKVQKVSYNKGKLSSEKIESLEKIGMNFKNKNNKLPWNEWYKYAKIYYEHHGNLDISVNFKTDDGYTYNVDGKINLGTWILQQRVFYRKNNLSIDRIKLLEDIKMNFNYLKKLSWEEMYELAQNYYEHYGNLDVPYFFSTQDGYTFDNDGKKLGMWISTQRKKVKKGTNQEELLNNIGMRFENKNIVMTWDEWYNFARIYYEFYGNLNIRSDFKTKDGYTYAEDGYPLGRWLIDQRHFCKIGKMYLDRIDLLNKIGANLSNTLNEITWEEYYQYATIYYHYNKNLNIKRSFKTDDGYTQKKDGKILLGNWIFTQIELYKKGVLSNERKALLDKIEIKWTIKQHTDEIIEICNLYNIEYSRNNTVLKHITISEFHAKIKFLIENNVPITNEYGKLHKIFDMSSDCIKEKYGISLIELIDNYYINNKKNK